MSKAGIMGWLVFATVLLFALFPMLNAVNQGFALNYEIEEQTYGNYSVDDFSAPAEGTILTDTCNSGDTLYPSRDSFCVWEIEYNMSEFLAGTPDSVQYSADMTDGTGNLSVRAYANESLVEKQTELLTGENITVSHTEDFQSFTDDDVDIDRVEVEFNLTEEAGDNDQRPAVDSYTFSFIESYGEQSLGLGEQIMGTFIVLLFLFVVVMALWRA